MTSLAAALAVALTLGAGGSGAPPPDAPARPGQGAPAATNAARARAGLLPRKPAKKVRMTARGGRRIITSVSYQPTFLGEPEPVPEAPADGSGAVIELVASAAPEPTGDPEVELPPALSAPVPVSDAVHLAASDVVTQVTLSLRFHGD